MHYFLVAHEFVLRGRQGWKKAILPRIMHAWLFVVRIRSTWNGHGHTMQSPLPRHREGSEKECVRAFSFQEYPYKARVLVARFTPPRTPPSFSTHQMRLPKRLFPGLHVFTSKYDIHLKMRGNRAFLLRHALVARFTPPRAPSSFSTHPNTIFTLNSGNRAFLLWNMKHWNNPPKEIVS